VAGAVAGEAAAAAAGQPIPSHPRPESAAVAATTQRPESAAGLAITQSPRHVLFTGLADDEGGMKSPLRLGSTRPGAARPGSARARSAAGAYTRPLLSST